jgi:hypothetical protein
MTKRGAGLNVGIMNITFPIRREMQNPAFCMLDPAIVLLEMSVTLNSRPRRETFA